MLPARQPRVLIDPVSAFFAGFTSVFSRMFLGGIAIGCGLAVGVHWSGGWDFLAIFGWAERGAWFLLGLSTLISIFVGLWVFVHGADGRRTFFFIFSAASLHFSPALFPPDSVYQVLWALGIYGIASACYWGIPRAFGALMKGGEEEVETVAPAEEHHAGEQPHETDAQRGEPSEEETPITGAEPFDHPADEEEN